MRALVIIALLFGISQVALAALTEEEAVAAVKSALNSRDPGAGADAFECLSVEVEDATDNAIEVVVREIHGGNCGGDPDTSPVRDRFQVDRADGVVRQYDPIEDAYVELR